MQPDVMNPSSSADYLIQIVELPGVFWNKCTSPERTWTRPTFTGPESAIAVPVATGSSTISECTLERAIDHDLDGAIEDWIQQYQYGAFFNVTIRPVKRNASIVRSPRAYRLLNCRMLSFKLPGDVDVSAADQLSMISITFKPSDLQFGNASDTSSAAAVGAQQSLAGI